MLVSPTILLGEVFLIWLRRLLRARTPLCPVRSRVGPTARQERPNRRLGACRMLAIVDNMATRLVLGRRRQGSPNLPPTPLWHAPERRSRRLDGGGHDTVGPTALTTPRKEQRGCKHANPSSGARRVGDHVCNRLSGNVEDLFGGKRTCAPSYVGAGPTRSSDRRTCASLNSTLRQLGVNGFFDASQLKLAMLAPDGVLPGFDATCFRSATESWSVTATSPQPARQRKRPNASPHHRLLLQVPHSRAFEHPKTSLFWNVPSARQIRRAA